MTKRDCGYTSAHQFAGKQDEVVAAIAEWITTGSTRASIE